MEQMPAHCKTRSCDPKETGRPKCAIFQSLIVKTDRTVLKTRTMADLLSLHRRSFLGAMTSGRLLARAGLLASWMMPPALLDSMAEAEAAGPQKHGHPHAIKTLHAPPAGQSAARKNSAPRLIMLDPGHGGKDPGAIGITGTYEKHVALAAAQELKRQLERTGRYRVEMTRTNDTFIPLDGRVDRAQSKGASLFISMHADALHNAGVRGASVYTLATSASDAQTASLAKRENSVDRFGGPAFSNQPPDIARILTSLVRRETKIGSARLSHSMVSSLDSTVPMLTHPARHAGFVVLKAADIPSVLVEMGFMSNRQDEALLRRPDHRIRIATAMTRAVEAYFATSAGYAMRG
ncbi:N-acetylmuramoyl-L-alanine amidase [Granulibacter bethesdensis]|uniref:N-acetylmuramoyl-L-alanine amidase n=2 Tax=Granulibacter bethesdensis TaxID=364410 RepID=Q0BVH2_GRABC|nr:N-acetylmuramoyl-L-alanine amidase [Granulibacter bethesdensis CGDNIH1]AHJ67281.1 N-acetylmuramoyl-L-alanine amidase [Granulibacter bethesdensis]APH50958.1 N-acetylmuramoyl-L-alanine amidase [Granulibacter bethesdensis]APH63653.1 N-acetylmuramoyl-L-alanine amidase [Granulibacter bethesdensis]